MSHPKGYEKMVKQFADRMTKPESKRITPASVAASVAKEYDISARSLIQYINKLVDKGVLPKELKAEYETEDNHSFKNLVVAMEKLRRVKQDPDVEDSPGTEPAKYFAKGAGGKELAKSTKQARARHFDKKTK